MSFKLSKSGIVLMITGAVIVCLIIFFLFGGAGGPNSNAIIPALEQSNGKWVNEAAVYTSNGKPQKVILLVDNSYWDESSHQQVTNYDAHSWNSLLREEWRPADIAEVALIAFLKDGMWAIETVPYQGGPDITRYCRTIDVVLLEAKTGNLVDSVTLYGAEPREGQLFEWKGVTSLLGDPVQFWSLEEWLNEFVFPSPPPKEFIWKHKLAAGSNLSPVVADGRVFIGIPFRSIYCLEASSGDLLWEYKISGNVAHEPTVVNGKVYFCSGRDVYCLEGSSGHIVWQSQPGSVVSTVTVVADDKVYVGLEDNSVYCLNAANGAYIWNCTTGISAYSSLVVADSKVYLSAENDGIYCLDSLSGAQIWKNQTVGKAYFSPTIDNGRIYMGLNYGVYCLDCYSGDLIWECNAQGNQIRSSPLIADGRAYVVAGGLVYFLNATSGSLIGHDLYYGAINAPPVVVDSRVYVSAHDRGLFCYDALSYERIWIYKIGDSIDSSPAVVNNRLYISSLNGTICCLDPSFID